MSSEVSLFVSVPITCLREPKAREYLETLPCPAPSTLYGMLLALVGEEDRRRHIGAEMAVGLLREPAVSTVLRTMWRVKDTKAAPGSGNNRRPDFQELLTGLELFLGIRDGTERESPTLAQRIHAAFAAPERVDRYGGLSLGESTHLVDEIRLWRSADPTQAVMLVAHSGGELTLPVWVDHVGSQGTVFRQYSLQRKNIPDILLEPQYWTVISDT